MLPGQNHILVPQNIDSFGTFPIINGTRTVSSTGSPNSTLTCTLPSGIISNELLLVSILTDQTNVSWTFPAGWTKLPSSGSTSISIGWKIATGSEGSSINVSGGTSKKMACTYRISNYTGTPELGTVATGSSAAANPPNLVWSWGNYSTLVIATMSLNSSTVASAPPTGYTNLTTKAQGGDHSAWAEKNVIAGSEDPGAFTNVNAAWNTNTIAIMGV